MSWYYEVVFAFFLREDTPDEVLDELRWHLGLAAERPATLAVDCGHPMLRPERTTRLPGEEQAVLCRQYRHTKGENDPHRPGADHYEWALHARVCWHEDAWANHWPQMAEWLAPYAARDGYAGFFREQEDTYPGLFIVRDGVAHLCEWGKEPIPLS